MARHRVVVVGAGHRAMDTILPAIMCLRDWVELAGVVTRKERQLCLYDSRLMIDTVSSFEKIEMESVGTVIIAIPPGNVPGVLRRLAGPHAHQLRLLIDTPVLDPSHLGAIKLFHLFGRVSTSEDSIALPPIALAKRLIGEGAIGRLRHVLAFHSGYRHHALASLRQIVGGRAPTRLRLIRWNKEWGEIRVRFGRALSATIVEPRSYDAGHFAFIGERAAIADYPLGSARNTRQIGYKIERGLYTGMTIDGDPVPGNELDDAFIEQIPSASDLPDPSLRSMLKIRAFMDLVGFGSDDGTTPHYDPLNAIGDSISLKLMQRTGRFADIRLGKTHSAFSTAIRLSGRLRPNGAAQLDG